MDMIPVHRPRLPSADKISPYLTRIDEARWYSNFGPLLKEFESRLAAYFAVEHDMVTTAGNGTLMLTAILKALNVAPGSLCVMPSWTFIATAASAHYAGLIPYFVDVDQNTQALNPQTLKNQLADIKQQIGAIIVIAPFGADIDIAAWDKLSAELQIPIVIDAAAGFDTIGQSSSMQVGTSPIMVSMHATKVFGIGEGGIALSKDTDLIWKIKSMTGFGLNLEREALILGTNAKLSEYTAAVGLAALDEWEKTREQWASTRDNYIKYFQQLSIMHTLSPDYVTSTCNIILPNIGETVAAQLKSQGIDTRKWWLNGCHKHRAYKHFPRVDNLSNTEWLSQSILGMPFAIDMPLDAIHKVCYTLKDLLSHVEQQDLSKIA